MCAARHVQQIVQLSVQRVPYILLALQHVHTYDSHYSMYIHTTRTTTCTCIRLARVPYYVHYTVQRGTRGSLPTEEEETDDEEAGAH